MVRRVSVVGVVLLSLVGIVVSGCSSAKVSREETVLVKGKLTNGGKPLTIPEAMAQHQGARPMVSFIRIEEGGQSDYSVPAITEVDGSFEVEIPVGKYRVAVRHPYAVQDEKELLSKFEQRNSTIEREITEAGQELNIDLANPNGS